MSRPKYVLVEGGHLHRNPSFEDCNVDDAAVTNRFASLKDVPKAGLQNPCDKCQPLANLEVNEEPEDATETPDPADG